MYSRIALKRERTKILAKMRANTNAHTVKEQYALDRIEPYVPLTVSNESRT